MFHVTKTCDSGKEKQTKYLSKVIVSKIIINKIITRTERYLYSLK